MSAAERVIDFACAEHRLPPAVRADALRLLADTLAVGAAGAGAPGAEGVLSATRGWGSGEVARTLGGDTRLPPAGAAFVNAFRIHCLEWDAVHEPAVVHALSVVTAALGAAIDRQGGCDPDEALTALSVGVEVAAGLGVAASSPLAFFRPAVAGCMGAALAVARIGGAPVADTFGLAYGFCAGTMQAHVEGSIALPLQIANAARAAVTAADLAAAGLTGPRDVLDGPFGYFHLFDDGDSGLLCDRLGEHWRICEVSTKPFPSGRASHGVLDGIIRLQAGSGVAAVTAEVPPLVHRLIGRPYRTDMTPAYARLCGQFLAALMMTDGRIDPRRFTPEVFADPAIAALAGRIEIAVDRNPDLNALSPQRISVDGRELIIPATLGSPAAPLSAAQAEAKGALARELALPNCDPRLFEDPLGYFIQPKATA